MATVQKLGANTKGFDFNGRVDGNTSVSFISVDMEPGGKVRLHRHEYDEIFVILEGTATFRAGGETIGVTAGDVVISPAHEAHGFENTGTVRLRQIDIHVAEQIRTVWIEED